MRDTLTLAYFYVLLLAIRFVASRMDPDEVARVAREVRDAE